MNEDKLDLNSFPTIFSTIADDIPMRQNVNNVNSKETRADPVSMQHASPVAGTNCDVDERLLIEINNRNRSVASRDLEGVAGGLEFHCIADLDSRSIIDTASMTTLFQGYESILTGKSLQRAGLVSSMASGICGGVHATASALCLEMALNLRPPPLGIIARNLLLSCQYLSDNAMHLFVLSGPDYSERVFRSTNPEIWKKAENHRARNTHQHGYSSIGEIMSDLNKPDGRLYQQALQYVRIAREAYTVLGGQYPQSKSIVPGGAAIDLDGNSLDQAAKALAPFASFVVQTIGIWDELLDFLYEVNPQYKELGKTPANILDFGHCDDEDAYDASYLECDVWGTKRWSTPGAIVNGTLRTNRLSALNCGIEEFSDYSYFGSPHAHTIKEDLLGNAVSPFHPWNKSGNSKDRINNADRANCYSWGSAIAWNRQSFEVGAYAKVYLSAISQSLPDDRRLHSDGASLQIEVHRDDQPDCVVHWKIPETWNAFERNRARAYAMAFNLIVTNANLDRANALIDRGETQSRTAIQTSGLGDRIGVGFCTASRGLLGHWVMIKDEIIDNYQIAIPSRINAGTRTPWGALGPLELAVLNSPILETGYGGPADFTGIDIRRTLQSFDPCMTCTACILVDGTPSVIRREVDTAFPI